MRCLSASLAWLAIGCLADVIRPALNSDVLLYDRETRSLWSPHAVTDPTKCARLSTISPAHTTPGRKKNSDSEVLCYEALGIPR